MIHSFSVSNYGSVRDTATLDLRIRGTAPELACFRHSSVKPDLQLPAVAVLMGPNGSGKTTIMRALVDMAGYVSSVNWTACLVPFLGNETHREPTRFSLEGEWDWLSPGGAAERFRLELVIGWTRAENGSRYLFVNRETLVHFPRGRRRRLYERRGEGGPIYVSRDFGVRSSDDRLRGFLPTISGIATMAMFDVPVARRIAGWMGDRLRTTNIVGNDTRLLDTETAIRCDRGESRVETLGGDPARSQRCRNTRPRSRSGFPRDQVRTVRALRVGRPGGPRLGVHRHQAPLPPAADDQARARRDRAGGSGRDRRRPSRRCRCGGLLRMFRSRESNPRGAQLLVTSHHVGLLDELEKEEVFIVDKDAGGATQVYGAQDVRGLRRDVRLYPKYRAGALGRNPPDRVRRSRRRPDVPRRRVVFVGGIEGKSDRAFARYLGLLCDEAGLHVHIDAKPCNGGDSLEVVKETARRLRRHPDRRGIATRLVLLDLDRMEEDQAAGRDALTEARKHRLEAVLFKPNLEGLLVRLHKGCEAHRGTGPRCGEPAPEALADILQVVADGRSAAPAVRPRRSRSGCGTRPGAAHAAVGLGARSAGVIPRCRGREQWPYYHIRHMLIQLATHETTRRPARS